MMASLADNDNHHHSAERSSSLFINAHWEDPKAHQHEEQPHEGISRNCHTPQREDPALKQLDEAIFLLPLPLKAAYLEALEKCPALIPIESNPLLYLIFCNYNLWSAAERLAHYWTQRRAIFGPDRAFLPLNLSSSSAYTPEDIALIRRGSWMVTSPHSFVLDHSLANGAGFSSDAQIRQVFFVGQTLSQLQGRKLLAARVHGNDSIDNSNNNSSNSATLSHDGIVVFRGTQRPSRHVAAAMSELMRNVFPCQGRHIHTVILQGLPHAYLLAVLGRAMTRFGFLKNRFVPHPCQSAADAAPQLARYGIAADQLPTDTLGGTLDGPTHWAVFLHTHAQLPLEGPHDLVGLYGGLTYNEAEALWPRVAALVKKHEQNHSIVKVDSLGQMTGATPALANQYQQHCNTDFTNDPTVNTTVERGMRNMKDAIDMLPSSEKAAYRQALEQYHQRKINNGDVDTVRQELLSFLQYCHFDIWSAAKRLALYWKHRYAVFQDQAFIPLSEITNTESSRNMAYILPKDKLGRTVLCLDWGKFCAASQPERLRALFELENRIVNHGDPDPPHHPPQGMAVLILVQRGGGSLTTTLAQQLTGSSQQLGSMIRDALRLPSSATAFHVICPSDEVNFIRSWILPLALSAYGCVAGEENRWMVHDIQAPDLLETLESSGLSRHSLPKVMVADGVSQSSTSSLPASSFSSSSSLSASSPEDSVVPLEPEVSPVPSGLPSSPRKAVVSPPPNVADEVHEVFRKLYDFPIKQTAAYQKAIAQSPGLVKKESDPRRFLRFTNHNVPAAAEMLLRYWQRRQELFGSRALLPLDQTCEGCLERKDVAVLQTGFVCNLPCLTPQQDAAKSVLFCDRSKLQPQTKITENSLMRCVFYMWSVMAENEESQQEGFQLLFMVSEDSSALDQAFRKCLDVVLDCVPARVERVHFLGLATPVDYFENTVELLDMSAVTHRHCVSHRNELAQALSDFGFSKEDLPVSVAGDWGYEDFVKWQELRVRHEWGLFIKPHEAARAGQYNIPRCPSKADHTAKERAERKRRMMIVHSRCKREREKMATEDLREQKMQLEDEQSQLTRDHKQLSGLLHQARSLVSMFVTGSSDCTSDRI